MPPQVESTIEEALGELTEYYRNNNLRANPDKTQVTAFQLRNRGKEIIDSIMERSSFREYYSPQILRCDSRQDVELQTAHTEHQDESSYPQQPFEDILDSKLNKACRAITVCLKPSYVEDLYLFAEIAHPDIMRDVCARMERTKSMEQETHFPFGHIPARSRLKS